MQIFIKLSQTSESGIITFVPFGFDLIFHLVNSKRDVIQQKQM